MDVYDPVAAIAAVAKPLAPRPASLRGLRIGVLDNSKPNAGVLLERLAELLSEREGARVARRWTKPGASRPAAMLDDIGASVDVLLTGSAD